MIGRASVHIEVVARLGEGGMGEVYRATDTKLKRQVALKVLPASVAGDAERLARFQREAEVLASLNHPNIAAIHGLEESDGVKALVMELVEGATLAERIAQRRDPARRRAADREANRRGARSGARAGDHSSRSQAREHQGPPRRHGEGAGLRPGEGDGAGIGIGDQGSGASQSPTITTPAMTQAGMILGTAAYMAPGAGARENGGQARRHLGVWRRPLRDADRASSVRGRRHLPHAGVGLDERARMERLASDDALGSSAAAGRAA